MGHNATGIPAKLRLSFDAAPSAETRGALGYEIHAFHAQTVPYDAQRFALLLHDAANRLVAGLSGVLCCPGNGCSSRRCGSATRGAAVASGERC